MSFQAYEVMSSVSTYQIINLQFSHPPQLIYPTSEAIQFPYARELLESFTVSYLCEDLRISLIAA